MNYFKVSEGDLRKVLAAALEKGGDYADLFFEHSYRNNVGLQDGAVNRASSNIDFGMGVRVLAGDQTGYAYVENVTLDEMLKAARTAARIATGSAITHTVSSVHTYSAPALRSKVSGPADLEFRRLVVDEERRRNAELPIDSLIALGALRELKRLTVEELAERIQRDVASAKRTLEALTEAGFVEAHGATRGRTYMLSAAVYGAVADKAAYTRQAGFAPIQHEQMVLSYVRQHGRIKRAEAMELCRLSEGHVKNLLKRMCKAGLLVLEGAGPAAHYRIGLSDRVVLDEIG